MWNECREQTYTIYPPSGIADDSRHILYSNASCLHVPFFDYLDFNEVLGTRIFTIHDDTYLNSSTRERKKETSALENVAIVIKIIKNNANFFSPFSAFTNTFLCFFFFFVLFFQSLCTKNPFLQNALFHFFLRIIKFEAMRLTVMSGVTCYLFSMQIKSKSNFLMMDYCTYVPAYLQPTVRHPTFHATFHLSHFDIRLHSSSSERKESREHYLMMIVWMV